MATPKQQDNYQEEQEEEEVGEEIAEEEEEEEEMQQEVKPDPVPEPKRVPAQLPVPVVTPQGERKIVVRKKKAPVMKTEEMQTELLPEIKPEQLINFDDFMDVKGQYDVYARDIERSKVPFNRMDPVFQATYFRLQGKLNEEKKSALDYTDRLEKGRFLPSKIAHNYRCGIEDNNISARAQENVLTYVAASIKYNEHNMQGLRLENETLKRRTSELEEDLRTRHTISPQQKRQAIAPAPAQRQQQQQLALRPAGGQQKKVNILGIDTASTGGARTPSQKQPAIYGKWLTNEGVILRPESYDLDENQAGLSNVFEEMLGSSLQRY